MYPYTAPHHRPIRKCRIVLLRFVFFLAMLGSFPLLVYFHIYDARLSWPSPREHRKRSTLHAVCARQTVPAQTLFLRLTLQIEH